MLPASSITIRRDNPSSQDVIVPLVRKLLTENPEEKIIVFRNMRGSAQGCANYLAKELGLPSASDIALELPNHDLSAASSALRDCLNGGTAFHNTNLNRLERSIVERAFRNPKSKVRILGATTTVAAGINTPASTVILAEQEFVGEDGRSFTVAEYKNMAGRAGRLGYNEKGRAIILADSAYEREALFNRFVMGKPEPMDSSFDPKHTETWIIRLLAQINKVIRKDIIRLLANTYGGYLANNANPSWHSLMQKELEDLLTRMISLGLVEQEDDFVQLTLLGRACGQSSLSLSSAMRFVELLRSTRIDKITVWQLIAIVQGLMELDTVYTPLAKRSHLKESQWQSEVAQRFGSEVLPILQRYAGDNLNYYARCKRASILYDWTHGVSIDDIERTYSVGGPYAGRIEFGNIRSIADATRFHLRSACKIADAVLIDKAPDGSSIEKLLKQLEIGISEDMLGLVVIPIALERGEYLALVGENIKTLKDFLSAPSDLLQRILGATRVHEIEKLRSMISGINP